MGSWDSNVFAVMWDPEACPASDDLAIWGCMIGANSCPGPAGNGVEVFERDSDSAAAYKARIGASNHDDLLTAQSRVAELTQELQDLRHGQQGGAHLHFDDRARLLLVDSLRLKGDLTLTVDEASPPIVVDVQQLCALPLQRTRELWRMYMTAFAEQLLRWQGNAHSPAALRLSRLYYEAYQLWMSLHCSPQRLLGILERADDPREASLQCPLQHQRSTPGPHHQRMLAAARLSKQQQAMLCALHCAVFTNFGRLQSRRARCISQLQAAVAAAAEQARGNTAGAAHRPDEGHAVAELKAILLEEHCQCMLLLSLIWTRVLTCFQGALLKVLAWPDTVDMLCVCELIACEAGAPSTQLLLQQGSQDAHLPLLELEDAMPAAMGVQPEPPVDAGRL